MAIGDSTARVLRIGWHRPNPRTARVLLVAILAFGVLGMHSVGPAAGMAYGPMRAAGAMSAAMPTQAHHPAVGRSATSMQFTASMPMSACDAHSCVTVRGAAKPAPSTPPCLSGGIAVTAPADSGRESCALRDGHPTPRPPPRSGSCSPLCVWVV